jgi:hypothetical protein
VATKQISVRVEIEWLERIKAITADMLWMPDISDYVRAALIRQIERDEDETDAG